VKYRDVSHIWEVIMQGLFYLTPIIYPLSLITNTTIQKIIIMNPMGQAIQDARNSLVTRDTLTIADVFHSSGARLVPVIATVVVLVLGVLYFKREAKNFAENL
jgi:ABC-2 type transport system permease protein